MQKEIAKREKELETLKTEAARWESVLGRETQVATTSPAPRPARATKRPRLDWDAVLIRSPKTFTAKEVAQKTGKPIRRVYSQVSYWIKGKKVRRGKNGYQKVSTARSPRPQEKQERQAKQATAS